MVSPVTPYLRLITEGAAQRDYPLREVYSSLRRIVRIGARVMAYDTLPTFVRPAFSSGCHGRHYGLGYVGQ